MKIDWTNNLDDVLEFLRSESIAAGKRYWVVDKESQTLYYVGQDKSFGVRILTQDISDQFQDIESTLIR